MALLGVQNDFDNAVGKAGHSVLGLGELFKK